MVDSAPQWEAVLRRQKEKTQVDPNNRRSRHRSRSYVVLFPISFQIQELAGAGVRCSGCPLTGAISTGTTQLIVSPSYMLTIH